MLKFKNTLLIQLVTLFISFQAFGGGSQYLCLQQETTIAGLVQESSFLDLQISDFTVALQEAIKELENQKDKLKEAENERFKRYCVWKEKQQHNEFLLKEIESLSKEITATKEITKKIKSKNQKKSNAALQVSTNNNDEDDNVIPEYEKFSEESFPLLTQQLNAEIFEDNIHCIKFKYIDCPYALALDQGGKIEPDLKTPSPNQSGVITQWGTWYPTYSNKEQNCWGFKIHSAFFPHAIKH